MAQTDKCLAAPNMKFTLDGKRLAVLQNFTISGSIDGDVFVHFDGERLEVAPKKKSDDIPTVQTYVDQDGVVRLAKYKISERLKEKYNGYAVVQSITVDEHGNPTINLKTLLNEKEQDNGTR
jgi:hypothetical protein